MYLYKIKGKRTISACFNGKCIGQDALNKMYLNTPDCKAEPIQI